MPISDIVALTITTAAAGPTRAGFGVPLILGYSQRFAERLRFYTSSVAMIADGFLSTDPEVLAARAFEAQNPRIERWAVGRGNNKPTMSSRLTISQVLNSTAYKVKVNGTEVTFTSDANATEAEIRAGVKAAIDALGLAVTVTDPGAGAFVTAVANAAGGFFTFEVVDPSLLALSENHADPGVAADLDAIALYDNSWYALVLTQQSAAMILAAAAWVESAKKLLVARSSDTLGITATVGGGDVLDTLKTSNYGRTAGFYHPNPRSFADAALLGNRLPFDPGSETWKFARLSGVEATTLTTTHQANLDAKRANYHYTIAGVTFVAEGKVAANEFIDKVRGLDWQSARIGENVFGTLVGAQTKVPFTDQGAKVIGGSVLNALREGVTNGLLAEDPAPAVQVPDVSDVPEADRLDRFLSGITFSGNLAGAVHKVGVTGQLSI